MSSQMNGNLIFPTTRSGIQRLSVKNFRSFASLRLEFQDLNIFVGPNSSGKSNLFAALRFLRDIARDGLDDAVSLQGGPDYLSHVSHPNEPIEFEVSFSQEGSGFGLELLLATPENDRVEYKNVRATYRLVLRKTDASLVDVVEDRILIHFECSDPQFKRKTQEYRETNGVIQIERREKGFLLGLHSPYAFNVITSPVFQYAENNWKPGPRVVLFDQDAQLFNFRPSAFFREVPIFNFEPDLAKDAIFVTGKAELESDGENLPIVLRHLLQDPEKASDFQAIVRNLLPYVRSVGVDTLADLSAMIEVVDNYAKQKLPGEVLSTGTMHTMALIVALYFDDSPVVLFEEPERYLHAGLIDKLVGLFESRSSEKQIFLTTHNSDVIKRVDVSAIFGIYRDAEGYSRVFRPRDNETISAFLENEVSIGDLNQTNLLYE